MIKKKFIAAILSAALSLSSISVFAYEYAGPVIANNRTYRPEVNAPIMVNDRILVDIDSFFRHLGLNAKYYEKDNKIIIDSADNIKRLALYIDDPVLQVYTYKTVLVADRNDITLDAAPVMVDGVAMCPLRGVLEALNIPLKWDNDTQTVIVNTKTENEASPLLKLSTDADDVNKGDKIDLYITLENTEQYKDFNLCAITNSIKYNKSEFSYISTEFIPGYPDRVGINADNGDFNGYAAKSLSIINNYPVDGSDIVCVKMTFEALTDNGGTLILSDGFNPLRGADNDIVFENSEHKTQSLSTCDKLTLDTTPIILK